MADTTPAPPPPSATRAAPAWVAATPSAGGAMQTTWASLTPARGQGAAAAPSNWGRLKPSAGLGTGRREAPPPPPPLHEARAPPPPLSSSSDEDSLPPPQAMHDDREVTLSPSSSQAAQREVSLSASPTSLRLAAAIHSRLSLGGAAVDPVAAGVGLTGRPAGPAQPVASGAGVTPARATRTPFARRLSLDAGPRPPSPTASFLAESGTTRMEVSRGAATPRGRDRLGAGVLGGRPASAAGAPPPAAPPPPPREVASSPLPPPPTVSAADGNDDDDDDASTSPSLATSHPPPARAHAQLTALRHAVHMLGGEAPPLAPPREVAGVRGGDTDVSSRPAGVSEDDVTALFTDLTRLRAEGEAVLASAAHAGEAEEAAAAPPAAPSPHQPSPQPAAPRGPPPHVASHLAELARLREEAAAQLAGLRV